jgi:D-alanine-D-alanine ligase
MPKLNIALLYGGISSERAVSLNSGQIVFEALNKERYEVFRYAPRDQLKPFILETLDKKFDVILPILHGPYGEDGRLQGLLDMLDVPYVFSGVLASALAMDKHKTKLVAKNAGLRTAKESLLKAGKKYKTSVLVKKLNLPIVVKPNELGSSVGIAIAKTEAELDDAIKKAFGYGDEVLLEEYIKGRELSVAVYEDKRTKALPVIEIIPKVSEFFDYRAKYEQGGSSEVCPAQIPDKTAKKVQRQALKIFDAMGCSDLSRVDFIWKEPEDKIYFLEINAIPGMTATSLAPQAAKAAGMELPAFLDKLIASAMKRAETSKKKTTPEMEAQVKEILTEVTAAPQIVADKKDAMPETGIPAVPAVQPLNAANTSAVEPENNYITPQSFPKTVNPGFDIDPKETQGKTDSPKPNFDIEKKHSMDEIMSQNNLG